MRAIDFIKKGLSWIEAYFLRKYVDNKRWKFENWPVEKYRTHHYVNNRDKQRFFSHFDLEKPFNELDRIGKHLVDCISEYSYSYKFPVTLEPRNYFLINDQSGKIIERSRPYQFDPWSKDIQELSPSWLKYKLPHKSIKLERAIIITKKDWFNYYHFFFDCIHHIVLCDKLGIDKNIPIIVPEEVKNVKYIKDFNKLSSLITDRELVFIKKKEYVQISTESIVVKSSCINEEIIEIIKDSIDESLIPTKDVPERIFLTRNSSRARAIKNTREIEDIAQKYGFQPVDTDGWSLFDQIAFFGKVNKIIGLHGAGLTNIMFAKDSIKLLEILPNNLRPRFYRDICTVCGHEYSTIIGEDLDYSQGQQFFVDPVKFEKAIIETFGK